MLMTSGSTFTGPSGTTYLTGATREVGPADVRLAFINGWKESDYPVPTTFALLPAANAVLAGTQIYTVDQGLNYSDGSTWRAVGGNGAVNTYAAGNTGTTPTPNIANGGIQTWTQNANVTWGAPTNPTSVGQQLTLVVTQNGSGGFSTAWNAVYKNLPKTPATSVANSKATYVFIWNGTYWSIPDNYGSTPFPYGAVGDGVTDDTAAVQAAANSGYCLLPAGFTFLVTSTITVPNNGTFIGEGVGVSILKGSAVTGAIVATLTFGSYVTIGNFRIHGTATHGCSFGANNSRFYNILMATTNAVNATFSFNGFHLDHSPFGCTFDSLSCDSAICGSTLTFSGSVGGATTGTISSGTNPGNGAYIMQFANGEIRKVTISAGTTATWSTALAAGTVTTVSYGASFFCGGGFNANVCNLLYTGQSGQPGPFNFLLDDVNNNGTSQASTFNGLVAQNGAVGLFIGENHSAHTFNAYYAEDVVAPVIIGNRGSSLLPVAITINGANLGGPAANHPQYANRRAFIDLANTSGVKIINPFFQIGDGKAFNAYPLTFTGGTATSAATAYAFVNAAGVIKGVSILDCGNYSVAPTGATVGTPGTGATFTVTTGSSPFGHTGVLSVAVTAGGSGFTAHSGMVPVLMGRTGQVCIDTPIYQWSLDANMNGISPILAYDSVNQASNDFGITILNDNGLRELANARTNGIACYKPAEFAYRQFLQIPTTGAMASFAVSIALFP